MRGRWLFLAAMLSLNSIAAAQDSVLSVVTKLDSNVRLVPVTSYTTSTTTTLLRIVVIHDTVKPPVDTVKPPVPSGGEPVFVAGKSTLVYQDNFDTYHLPLDGSGTVNQATFPKSARMQTNGTYSSDATKYMSATLDVGRAGSGLSLRSNNTLGNEGRTPQSGGINWMGPQGSGVVYPAKTSKQVFQYWFKTNPGGGPNANGNKWFEWWARGTAIPANDIRMQMGPYRGGYAGGPQGKDVPFTLNDQLGRFNPEYAAQPVGPYFNQVNDGNWHRLTIAWLSPSGAATRDGYTKAWLDGVKIIDCSAASVGVKPVGGTKVWCTAAQLDALPSFQVGSFQAWPEHVNGADANWSLWIDDFSWWTE